MIFNQSERRVIALLLAGYIQWRYTTMAQADTWYKLAGTIEAYTETHEAFLLEVGEHMGQIERLAQRLSDISDRDIVPTSGGGVPDIPAAIWQQCKQQIAGELSRHRLTILQTVLNAAIATDDVRRLGQQIIRPK